MSRKSHLRYSFPHKGNRLVLDLRGGKAGGRSVGRKKFDLHHVRRRRDSFQTRSDKYHRRLGAIDQQRYANWEHFSQLVVPLERSSEGMMLVMTSAPRTHHCDPD